MCRNYAHTFVWKQLTDLNKCRGGDSSTLMRRMFLTWRELLITKSWGGGCWVSSFVLKLPPEQDEDLGKECDVSCSAVVFYACRKNKDFQRASACVYCLWRPSPYNCFQTRKRCNSNPCLLWYAGIVNHFLCPWATDASTEAQFENNLKAIAALTDWPIN